MKIKTPILKGLVGTSVMTLFSHLVSYYEKDKFSEPQLLADLSKSVLPHKKQAPVTGWATHYFIGVTWMLLYEYLLQTKKIKRSTLNALIMGAGGGFAAIIVWSALFKLNKRSPDINYRKFYCQLFFAHLAFVSPCINYKLWKIKQTSVAGRLSLPAAHQA